MNRFLLRERYEPKDLFKEVKPHINLVGGTISGDDTVIEKPYSDPNLTEFIGYFWSGNQHRPIKGINLITLYHTDINGKSVPVNYRLDNKKEGKTKNDYFREMIVEVLSWGLKPQMVTGDSWYSSRENIKFLRDQKLGFMMGIARNRQVAITRSDFLTTHSIHWGIECYHRAIKQVCGIKRFLVRTSSAILNHFFCSIRAFVQL